MQSSIEFFIETKQLLYCDFGDYKKGFVKVNRSVLWLKLYSKDLTYNSKLFTVIQNIYKETKSRVLLNGNKSEYFISTVGVRQGENLSPILCNAFGWFRESFTTNRKQKFKI